MQHVADGRTGTLTPGQQRWEYWDSTIPLDLRSKYLPYPTREELAYFDSTVLEYLQGVVQEGWQAAEAIDWDSLQAAGRFEEETDYDPFELGSCRTAYRAVAVRLKRLVH